MNKNVIDDQCGDTLPTLLDAARAVLNTLDSSVWEPDEHSRVLWDLRDAVWDAMGLCEICDRPKTPDGPESVCESCVQLLVTASESPVVRTLVGLEDV